MRSGKLSANSSSLYKSANLMCLSTSKNKLSAITISAYVRVSPHKYLKCVAFDNSSALLVSSSPCLARARVAAALSCAYFLAKSQRANLTSRPEKNQPRNGRGM
ncbi:unnamed protein product [Chondrus crispus]|uniref:Uncharacterized protein n=1 Tax=Chondrus crispus TaxID=2769 RepID=R7QH10_CHOCR|nr:unnamed protein product [Chondrus crispus]CDF37812.1 unnamed protein product [Chondrus crispus]|eukprot:XP_005717683.1 unnamed protein product [Chondrus crispus]